MLNTATTAWASISGWVDAMRSFPPIRESYKGFDAFARQFSSREKAEAYIREHNTGARAGVIDSTQRDLLNYNFGTSRFTVDRKGRLGKRATATQTIRGKTYRAGWFVPLTKDEQDPEFRRLTKDMILADKRREDERRSRLDASKRGRQ